MMMATSSLDGDVSSDGDRSRLFPSILTSHSVWHWTASTRIVFSISWASLPKDPTGICPNYRPGWLNWPRHLPIRRLHSTNPPPGEEVLGFLELIQPLVDQACDRLAAGVAALIDTWPTLPFDPETIEDVLLMNLPDPLLMRLERTLVLELNVARLQGQLDGDTPAERFQSFIQRLRQPEEAIAILAEYPVLARQLTICVSQWAEVCLEFLDRLCSDWEAIRARFSPGDDPGLLVELAGGAGDTHRGGRSVMIATFRFGLSDCLQTQVTGHRCSFSGTADLAQSTWLRAAVAHS